MSPEIRIMQVKVSRALIAKEAEGDRGAPWNSQVELAFKRLHIESSTRALRQHIDVPYCKADPGNECV